MTMMWYSNLSKQKSRSSSSVQTYGQRVTYGDWETETGKNKQSHNSWECSSLVRTAKVRPFSSASASRQPRWTPLPCPSACSCSWAGCAERITRSFAFLVSTSKITNSVSSNGCVAHGAYSIRDLSFSNVNAYTRNWNCGKDFEYRRCREGPSMDYRHEEEKIASELLGFLVSMGRS